MGKKKSRSVAPKSPPSSSFNSQSSRSSEERPVTVRSPKIDEAGMIGISERFAAINRLILRDIDQKKTSGALSRYTKDNISNYLQNPAANERSLRDAVVYMYGASSHFRRLIQYFAGLSDLAYVVSPYKTDPKSANLKSVNRNYRKVLNAMSSMNVVTQFRKVLTVVLREDVFYGTFWVNNDNITVQQLPSQYCKIDTIENNVANVTFDFSYFDSNRTYLDYYPEEFRIKYDSYKNGVAPRYQELSSPNSWAIKCNNDILTYAMPPFAGILREVYDIEDYKSLKMTKTALENYAMVVMSLKVNDKGEWLIDYDKAKKFWKNLDSVLPEEIGSVLSPMDISKISFERTNTGDTNTVADAEQNLFSAAGVSSLLFNNEKASANALVLSIKADQAITYGIVKSIEDMVNRFIQSQPYGKNWKVTFLDCSPFNRKEMGDMYLKAAQHGFPTLSMYAASQGLGQAELDSMNFLENDVLGLTDKFKPLKSSSTLSKNDSKGATDEGGAPQKDVGDLSESGEQNREDA